MNKKQKQKQKTPELHICHRDKGNSEHDEFRVNKSVQDFQRDATTDLGMRYASSLHPKT